MQKFTIIEAVAAPLKRSNVDTDQIIPAVYLKSVVRSGFDEALFQSWRKNEPDFVLNQPDYAPSEILVAGPEFGTGSSREHAVWALQDYGFKAVLSSRFADIFRGNSAKRGLLAAVVDQDDIEKIWVYLDANPGAKITVDLEQKKVFYGTNVADFEVDDHIRTKLLGGLDDIDETLLHKDKIEDYEQSRPSFKPKTLPSLTEGEAVIEAAHYDTRSPIDPNVGVM
ncbi:3-isopropylmalate dehydratase small subunit [Actinomycetota bacterium]|nr:3-isopropylmalate dehydratase small subunit [Actinomycetota bacterium]